MFLIDDVLVSEDLYKEHFVCDLTKCKGACCWEGDYGAPLENDEISRLEKDLQKIKPFLDTENNEKIEENGFYTYYTYLKKSGTQLMSDGRCVFMTKDAGIAKCGIEKAYQNGATNFQKPISCHLYPIRVEQKKENGFEVLRYDQWNICNAACLLGEKKKVRLFEFLKESLIRKYGSEFYDRLVQMVQKFRHKI